MRALHSRKLEISMTHRAKDMSEIFFLLLGLPAPRFLTNSKKLVRSTFITACTTQQRKLDFSKTHKENLNFGESLLDPQTE